MTFFPMPCLYAVIEIDVEKTLLPLNDPIASAAGAAIKTTKCIVYLDVLLQLPFPGNSTFKYMVHLVGPGLRPEDPEYCFTPDMCIPIYPNTQHPSGTREPLRPQPSFPFANCYHWIGPDVVMDLRIWSDGRRYTPEERVSLPPLQHVDMEYIRAHDISKSARTWEAKTGFSDIANAALAPEPSSEQETAVQKLKDGVSLRSRSPPPPGSELGHEQRSPAASSIRSSHMGNYQPGERYHDDDESRADCESVYSSQCDSESSKSFIYTGPEGSEAHCGVDVFGLDSDANQENRLPIVNMWLDIGAHFVEEDIPDPMEFVKQYDQLVRVVVESQARTNAHHFAQTSPECETPALCSEPEVHCVGVLSSDRVRKEPNAKPEGFWTRVANVSSSLLKRVF
ncbi:uncharacterized protein TRAVEDRAFT_51911 [Trametes versicolor FP-101664 SS1]|uniref:uncharacterized protein n=1 Tax=Trametes versicolor (strain FP-101664) TaxID=717944 RepID=UPI000462289C|nr:uncharacterized protein TRAVEDRAFT_51911 [Trametes versicolor FP-101664 SS1]EIW54191.1 hypothetical protein TRAVEDRAFT_51911 [Trametes versicolor FP-101664 SS1]